MATDIGVNEPITSKLKYGGFYFVVRQFSAERKESHNPPNKNRKYLKNEFVNCLNFGTPGSKSFKNHIEPANLTKED